MERASKDHAVKNIDLGQVKITGMRITDSGVTVNLDSSGVNGIIGIGLRFGDDFDAHRFLIENLGKDVKGIRLEVYEPNAESAPSVPETAPVKQLPHQVGEEHGFLPGVH